MNSKSYFIYSQFLVSDSPRMQLPFQLDPSKIQSRKSQDQIANSQPIICNFDATNDSTDNTEEPPSLNLPPGYESYSRSEQVININLSFPPGFSSSSNSISQSASLPSKTPIQQTEVSHEQNEINEQPSENDNLPDPKELPESLDQTTSNETNHTPNVQILTHDKPNVSAFPSLAPLSSLSSLKSLAFSQNKISQIIQDSSLFCERKMNDFNQKIVEMRDQIDHDLIDLSQNLSNWCISRSKSEKTGLPLDEIVDTRNDDQIEEFLLKNRPESILIESSAPKLTTICGLLSFLTREFAKNKDLTNLWTQKTLSFINQDYDLKKLRPYLLEVKRVICLNREDQNSDISQLVSSKL